MPTCAAPLVACEGKCIDPQTDPGHCGASGSCQGNEAGAICADTEVCVAGICTPECPSGQVECNGQCIDPQADPNYCGASGTCQGNEAGVICSATEACIAGVCTPVCPLGQIKCDGQCVDPMTDAAYCGASGDCTGMNAGVICQPSASPCPGAVNEVCQAGQCVPGCGPGTESFAFTNQVESFALPACVAELMVKAWGAQGGTSSGGSAGGMGAMVEGSICVTPGSTLTIVVGEQPPSAPYPCGGGGGSFVALGTTPLFVAGGGGGGYLDWAPGGAATLLTSLGVGVGGQAHNDGGGGGGFTTNGNGTAGTGGFSFLNGAAGGFEFPVGNINASRGGFGGGGGSSQSGTFNAGGGGGFDGGNCGNGNASTGGTSFLSPEAYNTAFTGNTRAGHGAVELSW